VQWYLRPLRDSALEWGLISMGMFGIVLVMSIYFRSVVLGAASIVILIVSCALLFLALPPDDGSGMELPDWDFD